MAGNSGTCMTVSGALNGTWVWNGSNWSQMQPATNLPESGPAMVVYDANSQSLLALAWQNPDQSSTWTWK